MDSAEMALNVHIEIQDDSPELGFLTLSGALE